MSAKATPVSAMPVAIVERAPIRTASVGARPEAIVIMTAVGIRSAVDGMHSGHIMLPMTQEDGELDSLVRKRLRALRVAQGWSLEELAARARLSQSSLSRIENGQRRLALDQLVILARALDTTLDQLVETAADDVITNPMIDATHSGMSWLLKGDPSISVVRQRMTEPPPENPARMRAHPGREWLVVLSGTAILMLGHRRLRIETNQAAEFPTMMPHAIGTAGGPCDILGIFDRDARRSHQRDDSGDALHASR